jgi:CDGSH-type Zn-finger protein
MSAGKNKKKAPLDSGRIVISKNGPYRVSGGLPLDKAIIVAGRDGIPDKWGKGEKFPAQEGYALCRCGHSENKPYCTGAHAEKRFDGTETASRKKYIEQAESTRGPAVTLTDAISFCAIARYCEKAGSVWALAEKGDKKSVKLAIREACDCPAGRLVAWDKKTGKPIEPKLKKSISLVEDPSEGASGPIWVKGGVPIQSSDGYVYEIRNRVTLCRCGKSINKPFCDGTHLTVGFNDGDKRLKK